tara:strand:- start:22 stop:846 length:825 start_codon:yes stop_codon:yes gene_type:complete
MAVTNGWGKGVDNNSINWGRGKDNATNNWGKVYETSASGDTLLEVSTVPFSNTKSVDFDGADDYVEVNNSSSLQITGALSLSFWIYGESNAIYTGVITKTPFTASLVSNTMYHIEFRGSNKLRFTVTGCDLKEGAETTGAIPTVTIGVWQHIVMTWNGTNTMTVYKDGTQVATKVQATTISSNTDPVYLGRRNGYGWLTGKMDEIGIFNTELSASDVTAIYNSGTPLSLASYNPVSWWRMGDNDTFPTLTDNGSGGNNGTMTNMVAGDIVTDTP